MSTIKKSIEVNVPVHTAYNQWTQFEEFPHFMEGVKQVTQLDEPGSVKVVEFTLCGQPFMNALLEGGGRLSNVAGSKINTAYAGGQMKQRPMSLWCS